MTLRRIGGVAAAAVAVLAIVLLILQMITTSKESQAASKPSTKVFHIYAAELQQEPAQGTTLYSWGYGLWDPDKNAPASPPTVPGPELRVKEGDHVKVVFYNQQKEPHTIHFHGVDNSFAGDGTPGVSQHETQQGKTFTYEFDATHAGTYWYHCHVEPDRHPEMGLYGAFIVEPKEPKYKVDGETTLLLAERDPMLSLSESSEAHRYAGTGAEHLHLDGDYDTVDRKAKYFTINGKMDQDIPPLHVKKGGTYLIRLINAGQEVHSIHTHGHHFKVVASDGRDLPVEAVKDTITIGPGEKYDLLLTADNPGIWPIHCHMGPHGSHGMHMMMVYDGYGDTAEHQHHSGSGQAEMAPLQMLKHHFAMLKQYQYDQNYEAMKPELDGALKGANGMYNAFAATQIDVWNELIASLNAVGAELKPNADAAAVKKAMDALETKLAEVEQSLSSDPT